MITGGWISHCTLISFWAFVHASHGSSTCTYITWYIHMYIQYIHVQIIYIQVFLTCFNSGHFDFKKRISVPLPLSHVIRTAKFNNNNNNLIYRRWKTRGPLRELGGTIMRYVAPSGFQQESHKNVHKNLINHNFRRSMQGENHRIHIIFPRDFGYAWVHSYPEPDFWPRPSKSLGSQLGNA